VALLLKLAGNINATAGVRLRASAGSFERK
jgi:hypothetical protein